MDVSQIDLESLSREELRALNRRIVERLKLLNSVNTRQQMLKFRIGEQVMFETREGDLIVGVLTRFNQKTVTVIEDDGHRWNVHPSFLAPLLPDARSDTLLTSDEGYPSRGGSPR